MKDLGKKIKELIESRTGRDPDNTINMILDLIVESEREEKK